jgi:hypothetical protein
MKLPSRIMIFGPKDDGMASEGAHRAFSHHSSDPPWIICEQNLFATAPTLHGTDAQAISFYPPRNNETPPPEEWAAKLREHPTPFRSR